MSETPTPPRRRFDPTPIEETVKKVRKFAVEPVETTTRSSKENAHKGEGSTAKEESAPKRRFLPEPVETTYKSSKAHNINSLPTPELTPVVTIDRSPAPKGTPDTPPAEETPKPRRKFTPQLIESSKRSKRAGSSGPATLPTDKTDITPVRSNQCSQAQHVLIFYRVPTIYIAKADEEYRAVMPTLPAPSAIST